MEDFGESAMSDNNSSLEAAKAEANKLQSQMLGAESKAVALELAISAAEQWLKALKLTKDRGEKANLRLKCQTAFDEAERIKSRPDWQPLSRPINVDTSKIRPMSKTEEIDQWAASVIESASQSIASTNNVSLAAGNATSSPKPAKPASPSFNSTMTVDSTASNHNVSTEPATASLASATKEDERTAQQNIFRGPQKGDLLDSCDYSKRPAVFDVSSSLPGSPASNQSRAEPAMMVPTSNVPQKDGRSASFSDRRTQVKQLKEPMSSRHLSKKEEILLLRASKVNGYTFPPWNCEPAAAEFALANGEKIFIDTAELKLSYHQQQFFVGWVRAKESIPPPAWFPGPRDDIGPLMSTSRPIDLVQDAATDCSVVASLCAGIARSERGHEEIISNIIRPYDKARGRPVISPNGKYIVRLNFNGCWRKVIIDDRLPLSRDQRMLHVVDRHNPALLWPALLEKAYLKVHGGYDFPGSNSCSDLWAITGWIPEQVFLQETDTVPSQLWSRTYKAFLYGDVLVTVGTGQMSHRSEREIGLEGQHNYVVLDMKETDHERLFLIKNPWVEGRGWRGSPPRAAPTLDASSSSDKTQVDGTRSREKTHPGTFWISLDSVVQHFETLYLNWNPGLFQYRQDIHFGWDVQSLESEGGCMANYPQFSFTSKKGGVVWFLLCRHFSDASNKDGEVPNAFEGRIIRPESHANASEGTQKAYMSIYVFNHKGERVFTKGNYVERGPSVNTSQSLLQWEAEPSKSYTIVPDHEDLPPSSYTFSLSAYSNSAITLEPATHKYHQAITTTGSWTKDTAGGDTRSPRYFENPQFSLTVKQTSDLAVLVWTRNGQFPVHVKLVHGQGKRIHRLQNRDILVDSGDYRTGCALAEMENVALGTYTVICSLFEAEKTADFSLRVDSLSDCEIKAIPKEGAGLVSMKLANACFGPTVNKIAAPLVPRRLVACTLVCRFHKARSPRSTSSIESNVSMRSPLRVSLEIGRGPRRRFVVCSENGEYSDAASIRTESVDLEPNMLYHGDLWLVLDRLSGPGGSIEECYEVELFTDAPGVCRVGVWRDWDD